MLRMQLGDNKIPYLFVFLAILCIYFLILGRFVYDSVLPALTPPPPKKKNGSLILSLYGKSGKNRMSNGAVLQKPISDSHFIHKNALIKIKLFLYVTILNNYNFLKISSLEGQISRNSHINEIVVEVHVNKLKMKNCSDSYVIFY